jgi:signal peptidase I
MTRAPSPGQPRRRYLFTVGGALTIVVLVAAWVAFAPTQLGGQASYVVVNGNSMEPKYHKGDLVITREATSYAEGDVVAYRHPDIGLVIHRIIGRDGQYYVFQGDHNTFVDSFHPGRSRLVGRAWIAIPGVGSWLAPLRQPLPLALLTAAAVAGLGGAALARAPARRRRDGRRRRIPTPPSGGTVMGTLARSWHDAAAALALAAFALLALTLFAFTRSPNRTVPEETPYRQAGTFSYSAPATAASVYDSGAATTREPVFRRLSDQVTFGFSYTFTSQAPHTLEGTYRLVAEVGEASGWKHTFDLTPETPFSGGAFTAEGTLSLASVQELTAALEQQTGIEHPQYTLAVYPEVHLQGSVAREPLTATFSPRLPFRLDPVALTLAPRSGDEADPVTPSTEGLAKGSRVEANTLPLLVVSLPVEVARFLGVAGLAACMVVAGMLSVAVAQNMGPAGDAERKVHAKYAPLMVSVRGGVPNPRTAVIDVASVDDLARLAEREGTVILEDAHDGHQAYFVHLGTVTYRYEIPVIGHRCREHAA